MRTTIRLRVCTQIDTVYGMRSSSGRAAAEDHAIARPTVSPGIVHLALAIGGFAIGTTEFATMSLLRYFAHDLGIDEPTAGHVFSAYGLGVVIGAPINARARRRLPRRHSIGRAHEDLRAGERTLGVRADLPLDAVFSIPERHAAWRLLRNRGGLVAASLVPTEQRTQAFGPMLLGLTIRYHRRSAARELAGSDRGLAISRSASSAALALICGRTRVSVRGSQRCGSK